MLQSNKLLKIKTKERISYYNSDGKSHRDNDLPAVIWSDGMQAWYQNGKHHRDNGPAIIRSDGTQEWCRNGKRHRDNGPAIIISNGDKEWWVNGEFIKREKAT